MSHKAVNSIFLPSKPTFHTITSQICKPILIFISEIHSSCHFLFNSLSSFCCCNATKDAK
ncbi:MAG: hypothetical protein LBC61_00450 [Candidatus Peribacteria bacterium]|nr:hypothetical protein [Candidatus Peribacteria bacterium]